MRITPSPIKVAPPPVTVDLPPMTVTPPSFKATPPQITVTPPAVTVNGKSYSLPSITVTPPPIQVSPPPMTVDPPAITVDLPPILADLSAIEVEPEEEQTYVIVNPPAITVDPPAITIDPPSITVSPPPVSVAPPSITVSPPPFTVETPPITVDPPGPLPPVTVDPPDITVNPPPFQVTPPPFTLNPPPLTVDLPPITVNPPPLTIDPPPMAVSLIDFSWASPKWTTLVQNGKPENRLDIVFIGDGYTQSEQNLFNADVQRAIDAFRNTEPIKTYFKHFNFHRVNVISLDSGTSDLHARPPIFRRTALQTFYSPISDRRLVGPDPWVRQVVNLSGVPWDEIIVLVNSSRYGGATLPTMQIAYASVMRDVAHPEGNVNTFPKVVIHEAGHSIANLMDEYDEEALPDIDWPEDWVLPPVLPWVNVDTDPLHPKWAAWLTPGVSLPTPTPAPSGTVGAFKGAAYNTSGVYRPQENCLMRDHDQPFCAVCKEAWIASIYRRSRLADGFLPIYREPDPPLWYSATQVIKFKAKLVRSTGISITWYIRNPLQQLSWQKQPTESPDFQTKLSPGTWQVKCVLVDTSTSIRTSEVRDLARQEQIWNIITT